MFNVPLPSLLRFFFLADNVGSLKTQISQNTKLHYLAEEKKQKESIRERLGRGTLNTCANFYGLTQKRRGHWHLKESGVLCLNQPVLICALHTSTWCCVSEGKQPNASEAFSQLVRIFFYFVHCVAKVLQSTKGFRGFFFFYSTHWVGREKKKK